ncbi:hypothetical protein D9Q98_005457 [Chlorella vulgaris]|uniref:riboflavin kinase n=1 Tax=Chlorella vulgaris TaxID=3077 RepID=A0A9D4TM97_CHLVU|nr:hypothetical protein D9Q98_005457 [Chlorella vulgaris]
MPPVAAASSGGHKQEASTGLTRQEHAEMQSKYFDRAIGSLKASITPAVHAKLARVAAGVPGLGAASRVLDAGAGEGALIPHLQALGVQDILAVDVSPTMVEALQQRAGPESTLGNDACVRTWLGEIVDLPYYLGPFDAVFFNSVFGNLYDPHEALLRACFLSRPGSYIVISHPLGRAWHERFRAANLQLVPHELPQSADLASMVRDLPLQLVTVKDDEDLYLALLQVPEHYAHPYAPPTYLSGEVIAGFGRGSKQLGVPTANLPPAPLAAELSGLCAGVYFGWAYLDVDASWPEEDRKIHKMVMNIGQRPTFQDAEPEMSVEVHVMHEYSRDFYGEKMNVVMLGYIRPEIKFGGLQELLGRINMDIGIAKSQLDSPRWQACKEPLAKFTAP